MRLPAGRAALARGHELATEQRSKSPFLTPHSHSDPTTAERNQGFAFRHFLSLFLCDFEEPRI